MFTAQLISHGQCKQRDIIGVFGVSASSVKRSVKKYKTEGIEGFFAPRVVHTGGTVLTQEVKAKAQELLNLGQSRRDVAKELGIKYDTLRKAINQGRLNESARPDKKTGPDKSQRSFNDASASMGTACTRPDERIMAAVGMLNGASTQFEPCRDVSFGGVLCALPALISNGLFGHMDKCFKPFKGYYTTLQIFILLAYMALCRIKAVEQLQNHPPVELGKLMGLDRIPEVRCLRQKLTLLSQDDAPEKWATLLSQDWMEQSPEMAGNLYIDGHVRVYHGYQTKLPRRFVSRERLCLRGITDYWVNDALGQPYFVVERAIDKGMLEALRTDIVPRLLEDIPGQPSDKELEDDPLRHRFTLVFDREGYSPEFFREMWQHHRIACITYHKFPKDNWPHDEFVDTEVVMPSGECITMKLAERGSWIGDRKNGLWVREVRKLTESEHQTSLISTAYGVEGVQNAAQIFSRWAQENFFGYMMQHFAIDILNEYQTEAFPDLQSVINPAWRELERQGRTLKSKLTNRRARYTELTLNSTPKEKDVDKWVRKKTMWVEEIEQLEHELNTIKSTLKQTSKHIKWGELEEKDKFQRLAPSRKKLTDTVKLIAYRAETAMVGIVREILARHDDGRVLIQDLCRTSADILPDTDHGILNVIIHGMATPRYNRAIEHLLEHLNQAEFNYPGTNLRLVYSLAVDTENRPTSDEPNSETEVT